MQQSVPGREARRTRGVSALLALLACGLTLLPQARADTWDTPNGVVRNVVYIGGSILGGGVVLSIALACVGCVFEHRQRHPRRVDPEDTHSNDAPLASPVHEKSGGGVWDAAGAEAPAKGDAAPEGGGAGGDEVHHAGKSAWG